jgi:hypothetical protein
MATVNAELPTLLDLVKSKDPNGAQALVLEALSRRNNILKHMVFQEGNLLTGHRFTSRTALPSISWRKLNEGVTPSKSKTDQVDETVGMLAGMSVVDVEAAKIGGNAAGFRASEDKAFMASFQNEVETGLIYHSTKTAPEKFMGLAPRLDSTTGHAGSQIIKADPSAAGSDQMSAYLVVFGPESVFGIYPKGSTGGLEPKDMGEQLWDDGTGKVFPAYVTSWTWKIGLVVKDYRQVVRVANIDISGLSSTSLNLIEKMIEAHHQIEDLSAGRPVWLVNRRLSTHLHLAALNNTKQSTLTVENIAGQPVTNVLGVPVVQTDALLETEAVIS